MDTDKYYVYDALPNPSRMIRLIKILSTTPQVSCVFRIVLLDDSPVFSALSYMWGDASTTELITIDGRPLPVTTNLAHAMRDVHSLWAEGRTPRDDAAEQWLWADAICINQRDDQEKNSQVPLMDKIYSGAHTVYSWLGHEGETRFAIDAVNFVSFIISKLPCGTFIWERTDKGKTFPSKLEAKDFDDSGPNSLDEITT
tara:strand:+ start:29050 stop:29646 length:597 start_codon:yes stop_codon:yes gene_type:complete